MVYSITSMFTRVGLIVITSVQRASLDIPYEGLLQQFTAEQDMALLQNGQQQNCQQCFGKCVHVYEV